MRRIHRALDLTAFAQSQTLDGIGREKHVGGLWRVIPLRGTQESKTFFGHLEPAFHDDRLSLRLGRIATPIVTSIFSLAALVTLVSLAATLIIIAALLVVAAIAALSAAAAATSLIVALPLMATMSLMVTAMSTSTAAAALTEATLAAARTEGALMALLTLRPALLGISLKTRGISSAGA
jgi:hypothetical protein